MTEPKGKIRAWFKSDGVRESTENEMRDKKVKKRLSTFEERARQLV